MNFDKKKVLLFLGGALFGSAGLKLLGSSDAKNVYTHAVAAALRVKDSVMEAVTAVQENAADILFEAKEINEMRAEEDEFFEGIDDEDEDEEEEEYEEDDDDEDEK